VFVGGPNSRQRDSVRLFYSIDSRKAFGKTTVKEGVMPVYEFRCSACSCEFSELRPMARSSEPSICPECQSAAPRLISAPRLAVLTTSQRTAHQVNERSANEPRAMKKHVCSSGCSHTHAPAQENKTALRQSKSTSRPWMIGH